jgi:hypothetical protein
MHNFNSLNNEDKLIYQKQILDCVEQFEGVNFFLSFLEDIRKTTPHPLMDNHSNFDCQWGYIVWNKVIFRDKLLSLSHAKSNEKTIGKLLPNKETKSYKNILNLLRTLKPVKFTLKSKKGIKQSEIEFSLFDITSDNIEETTLNPLFDTIFFASVYEVKKVLSYTIEVNLENE